MQETGQGPVVTGAQADPAPDVPVRRSVRSSRGTATFDRDGRKSVQEGRAFLADPNVKHGDTIRVEDTQGVLSSRAPTVTVNARPKMTAAMAVTGARRWR